LLYALDQDLRAESRRVIVEGIASFHRKGETLVQIISVDFGG
jgi:hypothetical protein